MFRLKRGTAVSGRPHGATAASAPTEAAADKPPRLAGYGGGQLERHPRCADGRIERQPRSAWRTFARSSGASRLSRATASRLTAPRPRSCRAARACAGRTGRSLSACVLVAFRLSGGSLGVRGATCGAPLRSSSRQPAHDLRVLVHLFIGLSVRAGTLLFLGVRVHTLVAGLGRRLLALELVQFVSLLGLRGSSCAV
jgi:hypothetical protein